MTAAVPSRSSNGAPSVHRSAGAGVRYLELHLLWSDTGPVARVRLENFGAVRTAELVHVFAAYGGTVRSIGQGQIQVPPRSVIDGLIELDRDFPATGAWLQHDSTVTPVRVWAGATISRPQITADAV